MEETVNHSKRRICYFFVEAGDPFNSIRIQIERLSLLIESLYNCKSVVIHPGINNYKDQLSDAINSNELLFWHFGGLDFNLNPFKKYDNVYFVYHNITPAIFFWRYDPLVSFRSILGRLQLRLINKKNKWVSVSSFNEKELKKVGFRNISILPNIILNPQSSLLETKKSKDPSLIFVGRISPSKGCVELINNLKKLGCLRKSKVKLYIVGNIKKGCRYGKEFISAINDLKSNDFLEIHWFKNLIDEKLYSLYAESWVYVSMSKHEGFGLPACESILHNTPAIYLSSGGQESVLNNLGLIECSNQAKLFQAINAYLDDNFLRNELLVMQKSHISSYMANNWIIKHQKTLDKIFLAERL